MFKRFAKYSYIGFIRSFLWYVLICVWRYTMFSQDITIGRRKSHFVFLFYNRLDVVGTETSNRRTIGLWQYVGRTQFVQEGGAWKEELCEGKWKSSNYRNYTPESRGLSEKSESKVLDGICEETCRQTRRIGSEWHRYEQAEVYLSIVSGLRQKKLIYIQKSM